MDRAGGMRDVDCNVADLSDAVCSLVDSKKLRDHGGCVRAIFSRREVGGQRRVPFFIFQKRTEQMNEEQLEKHAVVDFRISSLFRPTTRRKKTHCITRTLGSCPSFGSISFGKSLRHASSRVCNSLNFFEASCLPIGFSTCVGL